MRFSFLLPSLLVLGACGGAVADEPAIQTRSDRFVGVWQVSHLRALVDEAVYRFDADGRVAALGTSCMNQQSGKSCVIGEVASCNESRSSVRCEPTKCTFGDRWFSEGESILAIEGVCTDGRARTIRFEFTTDRSLNAHYATTHLHSVGGDTSWVDARWPIGFRKCGQTETSCR